MIKTYFWHRIMILVPVLAFLVLAAFFIGCDSSGGDAVEKSGPTTFFVDWQDGDFKNEYTVDAGFDIGSDIVLHVKKKTGYEFMGFYTEKNGGGEQIFDARLKCRALPQRGMTYYAYWGAKVYSFSFRFAGDNSSPYTFTDGSRRVCELYSADTPLDFGFPEITDSPEVAYWRCNDVRVSDGNVFYEQYRTVGDLLRETDSDFINLYPVFATPDHTVILTLDFGSYVERVEVGYGASIKDHLATYTLGNRELVGWTKDRYNEETLIRPDTATVKTDTTVYAVWRNFSEVTLYGVDEGYFADGYAVPAEGSRDSDPFCYKRLYEFHPEYLATPKREGYIFAGWYSSPDFSGDPVSRMLSMELNGGAYYARWVIPEVTVTVRYNTGAGTQTVKVVFRVDETLRLKTDLSALSAPLGMRVVCLLKSGVPCTDEEGYWTDGDAPSPDYTAYYGAEVGE